MEDRTIHSYVCLLCMIGYLIYGIVSNNWIEPLKQSKYHVGLILPLLLISYIFAFQKSLPKGLKRLFFTGIIYYLLLIFNYIIIANLEGNIGTRWDFVNSFLQIFFSAIMSTITFGIYILFINKLFDWGNWGQILGIVFALCIPTFITIFIINYNAINTEKERAAAMQNYSNIITIKNVGDIVIDFKNPISWINVVLSVFVVNLVLILED